MHNFYYPNLYLIVIILHNSHKFSHIHSHYLDIFDNCFQLLFLNIGMIMYCDGFHGEDIKKQGSHVSCPQSFKPKYWEKYLELIGINKINTSAAEQNNANLRNLEKTLRTMFMSNYILMCKVFCGISNCRINGYTGPSISKSKCK